MFSLLYDRTAYSIIGYTFARFKSLLLIMDENKRDSISRVSFPSRRKDVRQLKRKPPGSGAVFVNESVRLSWDSTVSFAGDRGHVVRIRDIEAKVCQQ